MHTETTLVISTYEALWDCEHAPLQDIEVDSDYIDSNGRTSLPLLGCP